MKRNYYSRHRLVKERLDKEAFEMKEFYASEMLDRLNSYKDSNGRNNTTRFAIGLRRLLNFLKQNPRIEYLPNKSSKKAGKWRWIGDKE